MAPPWDIAKALMEAVAKAAIMRVDSNLFIRILLGIKECKNTAN
jgi:hypothetical protein